MWEFMKKKAPSISKVLDSNPPHSTKKVLLKSVNSKNLALYSKLYVRGINAYEKAIPDLVAHEMVRVCYAFGISESEKLGREVKNHLWVLKYVA